MKKLEYKNSLKNKKIESLVFSGGGAKGLAYAGVFKELEAQGILKNIKTVVGASAGAIIALTFALGYSSEEIIEIIKKTNFASFLDCGGSVNLPEVLKHPKEHMLSIGFLGARFMAKGSLCDGLVAETFIADLIEGRDLSRKITFASLYKKTDIMLKIVCCDVSRKRTYIHDYKTSPTMSVLDAVHASMSIPFVFTPVDIHHDGTRAIDGGTTYNYPLDCVENPLGFILNTEKEIMNPKFEKMKWAWEYLPAMLEMLMESSYNEIFSKQENIDRTIFIDPKGVGTLNFDMDNKKMNELIQSGMESTHTRFKE